MACELIGATKQKEGVKVLQQVVEEGVGVGRGSGFPGCTTLFPDILN